MWVSKGVKDNSPFLAEINWWSIWNCSSSSTTKFVITFCRDDDRDQDGGVRSHQRGTWRWGGPGSRSTTAAGWRIDNECRTENLPCTMRWEVFKILISNLICKLPYIFRMRKMYFLVGIKTMPGVSSRRCWPQEKTLTKQRKYNSSQEQITKQPLIR